MFDEGVLAGVKVLVIGRLLEAAGNLGRSHSLGVSETGSSSVKPAAPECDGEQLCTLGCPV
jgi:hypothetical protein